jgi:hypothetical protein
MITKMPRIGSITAIESTIFPSAPYLMPQIMT